MTLDKEKQATAVKPGLDTGWVCIKMWWPQPAGTRCRVALGAGSGGSQPAPCPRPLATRAAAHRG